MFTSIDEIRAANERLGQHWFSPATLRWFSSRISGQVYPVLSGGAYFVSSEQAPGEERRYTVRVASPDGSISTYGELGQYRSANGAHNAAARVAAYCNTEDVSRGVVSASLT